METPLLIEQSRKRFYLMILKKIFLFCRGGILPPATSPYRPSLRARPAIPRSDRHCGPRPAIPSVRPSLRAPTRNPPRPTVIAGSDPQSPLSDRHCGPRPAIPLTWPKYRGSRVKPGMTECARDDGVCPGSRSAPGLPPLFCTQPSAPLAAFSANRRRIADASALVALPCGSNRLLVLPVIMPAC